MPSHLILRNTGPHRKKVTEGLGVVFGKESVAGFEGGLIGEEQQSEENTNPQEKKKPETGVDTMVK